MKLTFPTTVTFLTETSFLGTLSCSRGRLKGIGLQQQKKKKKKKEWLLPYPRPNVTFGCAVRVYYLLGTSLAVQWLRHSASTAGGTGQLPGQGTKIPHASRCGQKEKRMLSIGLQHHPHGSKLSLAHLLSGLRNCLSQVPWSVCFQLDSTTERQSAMGKQKRKRSYYDPGTLGSEEPALAPGKGDLAWDTRHLRLTHGLHASP